MLRKLYLTFTAILLTGITLYAQTTALKVTVFDATSNETIPFAAVTVLLNNVPQGSAQADFDGNVVIKPLNSGTYSVQAKYIGFAPVQINNVAVQEGKTTYLDVKMKPTVQEIKTFEKIEYTVPLVDRNKTVSQQTVTRADFMKLGSREIGAVVSLAAGTFQKNEGGSVSIRGGRSAETRAGNGAGENSTKTFIDGQRVIGNAGVSQSSTEQVTVITGGIPAEYGDLTSGAINITTRGPGPNYFGGIEAITSQGLDKFGHNYISFNAGGPILFKTDKETNAKKPILGFFVGGEFITDKDNRPSFDENFKVKDSVLNYIERNPYRVNPNGGVLKNAEFLTKDDFETIPYRQNVRRNVINLNAKIDYAPTDKLNFTFGGSYNYNKYRGYTILTDRNNSLLNSSANQLNIDKTWRVWGRIRQRFGVQSKDEKTSSNIRNAFYTLQAGYTVVDNISQDERHRDKLQNYGYIGKFETTKLNKYSYKFDPENPFSPGAYHLTSQDSDVMVTFTPDTITNPLLTRYTQQYMDFTRELGANGWYNTPTAISANGGMLNGDPDDQLAALRVYNLWYNTGQRTDNYSKLYNTQFRINGSFSADIKSHAIQVGFEYEQRTESGYNFKPSALWKRGRQLANNHIASLDLANPHYTYFGTNLPDSIYYSRKFEAEKYNGFAKNIREQLNVADTAFLQVDALDKDVLNINQFSADNLFLGGSDNENLLSNGYYGYDVHGNRLKGSAKNVSFGDFWSQKDANGNNTRAVGSYKPIYIAGYIQDNFDFRDIKFNVGLRVDRFDANQKVLTDPYSFYATMRYDELAAKSQLPNAPDFVKNDGQNYVVYGDNTNADNLTQIYGYRNVVTNKWFDADGNPLADPKVLADQAGGQVKPVLSGNDSIKSNNFDPSKSFSDYKAQVNLMPRIAFSFPISDQANFFAHYDVLTQRPPARLRMDPTDYYFLQNNNQLPINNPNLKPEKNIDYEIGFAQVLNESQNSAITITAFYREMRNMIQVVRIGYAYPISYLTYGNIDFGTVKGLTFKYDLRRTKNIAININYTLQFAEGTGSSSTDAFNLLSSGQPNLRSVTPLDIDQRHTIVVNTDYHFGEGKDYDGPKWFGTNFLENTGANLTFRAGSGIPYTKNSNVQRTADIGGAAGNSKIDGSLNGSRLPASFRIDARFDRSITLNFGRKGSENRKKANLNIYLQVLNLLNTRNVIEVYKSTGNANDDGYLTNFRSQTEISQQINPNSYIDFYNMKMNDPRNFSLPRRVRLGATLDF